MASVCPYFRRVFPGILRGFVVGSVIYHSNLFALRHRNTVESHRAFSDGDRDSMNQDCDAVALRLFRL